MVAATHNPLSFTPEEIDLIFSGDDYALQRKVHLLYTHPLYTFRPRVDQPEKYDEQESFVNSTSKFAICLGGTGSGKTTAAAYRTARYLTHTEPMRPGVPFWVVGETSELVCGVCWGEKLSQFIPPELIKSIAWKNQKRKWPAAVTLYHPDGSGQDGWVIEFKSFAEGVDNFQARSIGGYWFNETAPMSIVIEVQGRCRDYDSPGWADFTPLNMQSLDWEPFYNDPPEEWTFYHLNSSLNTGISQSHMQRFLNRLPQDMRDTREFGLFASLKGQVYKEWRPVAHVIDPFEIPRDWRKFRAIDFGYNNPYVCLWVARDRDRNYHVFDEYFVQQEIHDTIAREIRNRDVFGDVWDPKASPFFGPTYSDHDAQERAELAARGIHTTLARKDIHKGIGTVRTLLKVNEETRKPRLFVHRNCENLIREFPRYRWPEGTDANNPRELPIDKDNHCLDALRYVINSEEGKMFDDLPQQIRIRSNRQEQNMPEDVRTGYAAPSAALRTAISGSDGAPSFVGGDSGRPGSRREQSQRRTYGNFPTR